MRHTLTLLTLAGGLSATGCASFGGQPVELSPKLPPAPPQYQAYAIASAAPMDNWLEQFNDDALESLILEALAGNPTIEGRIAAVDAARANARSIYGRTLPNVSASGSVGGSAFGFDDLRTTSSLGLGLNADWEADLWGRLRTGVSAARLDLMASEADLAAAELSIASQTAIAWFNLKAELGQLRVTELALERRRRTLELTDRRLSLGGATALDVRTARSAVAQSEADIANQTLRVGLAARSLEVLLGRYPAGNVLTNDTLPALAPVKAGGDPLLLLSRRPDIAAAEARVEAAGLRAEAARLAMRPSFRLSGSVDLSGDSLDELFDVDNLISRVVGSIAQPVFNGNALEAEADAALARARLAVADYTSAVLFAWQEVEDALQTDASLALQERAQMTALEEARLAEGIAERNYTNGLTTVFNLIDAQNRRLAAESAVISISAARATNRVRYHLALGGGVPLDRPQPITAEADGRSLEP